MFLHSKKHLMDCCIKHKSQTLIFKVYNLAQLFITQKCFYLPEDSFVTPLNSLAAVTDCEEWFRIFPCFLYAYLLSLSML